MRLVAVKQAGRSRLEATGQELQRLPGVAGRALEPRGGVDHARAGLLGQLHPGGHPAGFLHLALARQRDAQQGLRGGRGPLGLQRRERLGGLGVKVHGQLRLGQRRGGRGRAQPGVDLLVQGQGLGVDPLADIEGVQCPGKVLPSLGVLFRLELLADLDHPTDHRVLLDVGAVVLIGPGGGGIGGQRGVEVALGQEGLRPGGGLLGVFGPGKRGDGQCGDDQQGGRQASGLHGSLPWFCVICLFASTLSDCSCSPLNFCNRGSLTIRIAGLTPGDS